MSESPIVKYIIDSSAFIAAADNYYTFESFPGVWDFLEELLMKGTAVSHREVLSELAPKDDSLRKWATRLPKSCFPKETVGELVIRQNLIKWAEAGDYKPQAIAKFKAGSYADTWLCAKAKAMGITLVTQEVSAPNSKKDIKLPDACAQVGVHCIGLFDMIRDLKPVFVRK